MHQIQAVTLLLIWTLFCCVETSLARMASAESPELIVLDNGVRVLWDYHGEQACREFEIERSTDGEHFVALSRIRRFPIADGPEQYSFDDLAVDDGNTYYYRVKYISPGLAPAFSQVAETGFTQYLIQIGELNLLQDESPGLSLDINVLESCEIEMTIYHSSGIDLFTDKQKLEAGHSRLRLSFPALPSGLYYARIETARSIEFLQFQIK